MWVSTTGRKLSEELIFKVNVFSFVHVSEVSIVRFFNIPCSRYRNVVKSLPQPYQIAFSVGREDNPQSVVMYKPTVQSISIILPSV